MPSNLFYQILVLVLIATCLTVSTSAEGLSCSSCGDECLDACGTRFFRTCCFNYLRKRSSPPAPPQPVNPEFEENAIWLNKAELEKLIHNEMMHQQNLNILNQKAPKKDDFQKTTTTSNQIGLGNNNHDQMRVIYDI